MMNPTNFMCLLTWLCFCSLLVDITNAVSTHQEENISPRIETGRNLRVSSSNNLRSVRNQPSLNIGVDDYDINNEKEEENPNIGSDGKLRRLQAADFFPADDPYWNPFGVMERKPCIPFDQIRSGQITNPNADGECATNSCGGGCCRAYNWLLCDEDSSFPYNSCVCNENTWPADQWTKAPTIPRPTSPTPPPTTLPPTTLPPSTPAPVPAPAPAPAPNDTPPQSADDIVDTAIAAGSFNTLVDLVSTAGLVDALRGSGPFTVFAPTDAAFPQGIDLANFKANTDIDTLTSILLYHVVPGSFMASDLADGAELTTLQGGIVTITLPASGPMVDDANIIQTDIQTSNGIIHVIDAVLTPPAQVPAPAPAPDIVDTAIAAGSFNTLVDLLSTAGLADVLRGGGPFTVFAPVDAAFPQGAELESLKANTDIDTLVSILLYHVVPGSILSSDLTDGAEVTTSQGGVVTITLPASGPMVNDANIIQTDILTSNGIIHVIDAVLPPPIVRNRV